MKFLREIWAEIRRQEVARFEAYDKAPGHHWVILGLAYALSIGAMFATIGLAK